MFLTVSKWDVYFGFVRPIKLASRIVRSEKRAHEKIFSSPVYKTHIVTGPKKIQNRLSFDCRYTCALGIF